MKLFLLLLLSVTRPAFAEDVFIPEGACLTAINASIAQLGTSSIPEENEISFEDVLSRQGNEWEILYYKLLPADHRVLGIKGRARIELEISQTARDDRFVIVQECTVKAAQILEEGRN